MPITSQTYESKQLTIFTVVGEVYFNELMRAVESFLKGQPTQNVLWDFREAIPKGLYRLAEVSKIAAFAKDHGELRESGKTALVASGSFSFGLISMYERFTKIENHPQTVGAFRSLDEAITWLDIEKKAEGS
jgi:hypothetical protein